MRSPNTSLYRIIDFTMFWCDVIRSLTFNQTCVSLKERQKISNLKLNVRLENARAFEKNIKSSGWSFLHRTTLRLNGTVCIQWAGIVGFNRFWLFANIGKYSIGKKTINSVMLHKLLLICQAFVKFHEIPIKISFNGSPSKSPTGFLPYLKTEDSDTLFGGYEEIIAHFQSKVSFEFYHSPFTHSHRSEISSAFLISGLQRRCIFISFIHLSSRIETLTIR